jgi:hypothetical protein
MARPVIEYVQDILSDMDSDEVNSIDDTTESMQVAQILRSTYEAMMSNRNWPHLKQAIQIEGSGDSAYPTHMSVQSNVKELLFINYNTAKEDETKRSYVPIRYKESDEFLRYLNQRNSDALNVSIILDYTGIELLIYSDRAPTYYTSFDDKNVVFDSYNSDVDNTLQSSKVQSQGYVIPSWSMTNTFIPDIPLEAESALLEEAKSKAMFKLKQTRDLPSEREAARQQRWLSRKAWVVKGGVKYPNYGRTSRK